MSSKCLFSPTVQNTSLLDFKSNKTEKRGERNDSSVIKNQWYFLKYLFEGGDNGEILKLKWLWPLKGLLNIQFLHRAPQEVYPKHGVAHHLASCINSVIFLKAEEMVGCLCLGIAKVCAGWVGWSGEKEDVCMCVGGEKGREEVSSYPPPPLPLMLAPGFISPRHLQIKFVLRWGD